MIGRPNAVLEAANQNSFAIANVIERTIETRLTIESRNESLSVAGKLNAYRPIKTGIMTEKPTAPTRLMNGTPSIPKAMRRKKTKLV